MLSSNNLHFSGEWVIIPILLFSKASGTTRRGFPLTAPPTQVLAWWRIPVLSGLRRLKAWTLRHPRLLSELQASIGCKHSLAAFSLIWRVETRLVLTLSNAGFVSTGKSTSRETAWRKTGLLKSWGNWGRTGCRSCFQGGLQAGPQPLFCYWTALQGSPRPEEQQACFCKVSRRSRGSALRLRNHPCHKTEQHWVFSGFLSLPIKSKTNKNK